MKLYDVQFNLIMNHFFDMNLLKGHHSSTAEIMLNSIEMQLLKHSINWDNGIAFDVDNTSISIGAYNSQKSDSKA